MAKVLIIDDDKAFCRMLALELKIMGHDTIEAMSRAQGIKLGKKHVPDIVYLDVNLPDGNGLESIPAIRELPSQPEVIIITGLGDPHGAELAITSGAWDYIQKGSSLKDMVLPLVRALQYRAEKFRAETPVSMKRDGIIGSSDILKRCLDQVAKASRSTVGVLITGETGTGKELFSRAIHENSSRADQPFVVVDCTALPESLVESVLFGHKKGAFTGAKDDHVGLVRQADGGTLFLDEIGDLPPTLQSRFLRVLEHQTFRPVGARKEERSDFRLVAATNHNLEEMAQRGVFREDLLFRLKSFEVLLPPLRERLSDIEEIVMYLTRTICGRYGIEHKGFSPEFFSVLEAYDWPGNVRELVNAIERTIVSAQFESTLYPRHLPTSILVKVKRAELVSDAAESVAAAEEPGNFSPPPPFRDYIDRAREHYLSMLNAHAGGNKPEMCRQSGISRTRLYALLKEFDIS